MSLARPLLTSLVLIATLAGAQAQDTTGQRPAAATANAEKPHHVYLVGQLRLMQPWIDAETDTAEQADAYLVVENRGSAPDRLIGARLDVADRVTVSPSGEESDDPAAALIIPPGGSLTLKPDDAHLVLHGLHGDIKPGDRIKGVIRFERAGPVHVEFSTDRNDAVNDDQTTPTTDTGAALVK